MADVELDSFFIFINAYWNRLQKLKDALNTLDNRIGDGDHGTNMERGFQAAARQLRNQPPEDWTAACTGVAMALMAHVGGASGPLYGTVFLKLGSVLAHQTEVPDELLIRGLRAAATGISERGKAKFGEKTMLDVWDPVVAYLETHLAADPFAHVIPVVQDAVLATRERIAKKGRAAYLGARSQGTCDPGSVSSGVFFEELAKARRGEGEEIPWETLVL